MVNKTDQDSARHVDDRLAPPTTPDAKTIQEDRDAMNQSHDADRAPTPDEEAAAERAGELDPEAAEQYKDAIERGAAQKGEGRPGV